MAPRDLALVFLSSMAPSFEGRYALLAGIALGLDPLVSFAIASLGVSLVAVVLALIMPLIDSWASHTSLGVVRGLYQMIVLRPPRTPATHRGRSGSRARASSTARRAARAASRFISRTSASSP